MSKLTHPPIPGMRELGDYLREQRENAELSVRQLSAAAGISNPYLSQIERGLKKPSAEILQALAFGLRISAETLYVRAGLLEPGEGTHGGPRRPDVRTALLEDPRLSAQQRRIMVELYDSFVGHDTAVPVAAPQALTGPPAELTAAAEPATSAEPAGTAHLPPGAAPQADATDPTAARAIARPEARPTGRRGVRRTSRTGVRAATATRDGDLDATAGNRARRTPAAPTSEASPTPTTEESS